MIPLKHRMESQALIQTVPHNTTDFGAMVRFDQRPTSLQRDILKMLLYFDVFEHPLRLEEIYRFLPSNSVTLGELREACSSGPLEATLSSQTGYYYLKSRPDSVITDRMNKERRACRMLPVARLMTQIISAIPYVRAVFLSGELSKGVAGVGGDIDFFIVTAERRVWIVRTFCAVFKRIFLLNQKKFFCYNHIVSEGNLEIRDRNIYTAIEIATLLSLKNTAMWDRLQRVNSWSRTFLPNFPRWEKETKQSSPRSPVLERIINMFISQGTLDRVDQWLRERWRHTWALRYPALSASKRAKLFQCNADISTAYVMDFSTKILDRYEKNLHMYGLISSQLT